MLEHLPVDELRRLVIELRQEISQLSQNLEATVDRAAGSRDHIIRMRKKLRGQKERLHQAHETRERLETEVAQLRVQHASELVGIEIALVMLGYTK